MTGDLLDHVGGLSDIPHSIRVNLKTDSVGAITKFKLFVPGARYGKNEILVTQLFKELGFIVPRTALIKVQIGGSFYKAIFQ